MDLSSCVWCATENGGKWPSMSASYIGPGCSLFSPQSGRTLEATLGAPLGYRSRRSSYLLHIVTEPWATSSRSQRLPASVQPWQPSILGVTRFCSSCYAQLFLLYQCRLNISVTPYSVQQLCRAKPKPKPITLLSTSSRRERGHHAAMERKKTLGPHGGTEVAAA